ncbi:MAG: flagellar hook-associated protein FlgK [Candidatus Omnitrophota bacterium]|nr:MAG: flagellar hook-associated protein FlgK [Candidatus Omnitrophota bacterium]
MGIAGFNIGARALQAYQIAMQITGNNIANADTEGYSRQKTTFTATQPTVYAYGAVGTGVEVGDISRIRDSYLDLQMYRERSAMYKWQEKQDMLKQVELYFNEPSDAGLSNLMASFWNSWYALANNPEDQTNRVSLIQQSLQFSSTINDIDSKLNQLRLNLDEEIENKVSYINSLSTQIAQLNNQIVSREADGNKANDLRDKRGILLQEFAQLTDFTYNEQKNGACSIFIAGRALVWNSDVVELKTETNPQNELSLADIKWVDTDEILTISSGSIGGLLYARDTIIPEYADNLDTMCNTLIKEVNELHLSGHGLTELTSLVSDNAVDDADTALVSAGLPYTPQAGTFTINVKDAAGTITATSITITAGTTLNQLATQIDGLADISATVTSTNKLNLTAPNGVTFSNDTTNLLLALGLNTFFSGNDASNMTVNSVVQNNTSLIAAAQSSNPGDNSNARAIAALKDSLILGNGTKTIDNYYNADIIGGLGVESNEAMRMSDNQELIVQQLTNRIDEVSGVSLDEEMTKLIKYQQSYEAAAKYLVIVQQMLDTLLNVI